MATSGNKKITAYTTSSGAVAAELKFSWSEASQSIENNNTTVNWSLQLISYNYGYNSGSSQQAWSVVVDGNSYSGKTNVGIANNATKTLASGSTTIGHNADGTKTFSYSFSQSFAITFAGTYIGTKSGSGTGTLDTIARASQPSCVTYPDNTENVGEFGDTITIHMNRKSSSFTHKVRYSYHDLAATIAEGVENNVNWTIPLSFMSKIPNATSSWGTIYVDTYNGNTKVGTKSCIFRCDVPANIKPTVSIALSDPTGNKELFNSYVQSKSKIKVIATAAGAYGSTIKTYKTTVDGATYNTATAETGFIKNSGTLTVTTTVTDSRGRTATDTEDIAVFPYQVPKISAVSATRCNADGSANSSGTYIKVEFRAEISALNNYNNASYSLDYKKSTETEYTSIILSDYEGELSVVDGYKIIQASISSYDLRLTVNDYFEEIQKSFPCTSVSKQWSFFKKKLGIAIGKLAEIENLFDVALKARFRNGVEIDSDWVDLTLNSSFGLYNGVVKNQPKYKARAGIVTVKGAVSPTTQFTSSTDPVVIAMGIPSELRPDTNLQFICQGSGQNRWNCAITTDGTVTMSRYGVSEATAVPVNAWLIFCVTYQI